MSRVLVTVVAPFADQALNALQITEGIARLGRHFLTPAQRDRYDAERNAEIAQRNEVVRPELDPINEFASFLQNPTSLRDLVRDSYPRPRQGEEVRDDFAARLETDLKALNDEVDQAYCPSCWSRNTEAIRRLGAWVSNPNRGLHG